MDPWRSPVMTRHLADQIPDLHVNAGTTRAAREVGPVTAEALSLPSGDRIRLDDQQAVDPARPGATKSDPEGPIDVVERRPRPLPQERCDLLAKSQVFENEFVAGAEDGPEDIKGDGD